MNRWLKVSLALLVSLVLIVLWGVLSLEPNHEIEWLSEQFGQSVEEIEEGDDRFVQNSNGEWVFRDVEGVNWELDVRRGELVGIGLGKQVEIEIDKEFSDLKKIEP